MKKNKRPILILIGNYKNGGIATHATMLANGFSKIGEDVTIVIIKERTEEVFYSIDKHVSFLRASDIGRDNLYKMIEIHLRLQKVFAQLLPANSKFRNSMNYSISQQRHNLSLRRSLISFKNPIIIAFGFDYLRGVCNATKKMRKSILYATKTYAEGELGNASRNDVKEVLQNVSCVISQTEYTAHFFRGIGLKNVQVISNPLNMAIPPYVGERNKSIVNFCRISKEKRLDLLISAFSKFHLLFPEYHIDIYGNTVSPLEEKHRLGLLELIRDLELQDYVRIHEARKDIHQIIQSAAMFVSTSTFEGLSNSMIEAMALGLPCICTDCDGGGAREWIENGVNGLLIPKNDENALIKAMSRFAADEAFAEACGKNAAKIRQQLEISNVISQWKRVIVQYC